MKNTKGWESAFGEERYRQVVKNKQDILQKFVAFLRAQCANLTYNVV
jgi:hypothetical protein